ncbi:hypothetical protein T4D_15936 [Trichinella pseudospiralis]|uniref:Uncharacterized protein n=1 Tax=Trichinella pseudospiralis TaxID=6337 RepID=A0A0V1FU84_TRIPS|nr:hypothetical protein T4D_15936 [Trichinella pseudospiralis]
MFEVLLVPALLINKTYPFAYNMKVSHQWLQPRYHLYYENPQTLDIIKKSPMSLIKTLSALFINKPYLIPGISKLMPKGCRIRSIKGNTFVFFPGVSNPSVLLKEEILKESKRLFMRKYLQEKLLHYFYLY